ADVKKPGVNYSNHQRVLNLARSIEAKFVLKAKPIFRQKWFWLSGLALILVLGIVGLGWNAYNVQKIFQADAQVITGNFHSSFSDFRDFNINGATSYLQRNDLALADIQGIFRKYGGEWLFGVFGKAVKPLESGRDLISKIYGLNGEILGGMKIAGDLKENFFFYFQNDGEKLLNQLKEARVAATAIREKTEDLQKDVNDLQKIFPLLKSVNESVSRQYLSYGPYLNQGDSFLGALLDIFDQPKEIHWLLFFQNPAEIRPAGGFIGSYADLTIQKGQLKNIDVRDIYDPDGQFDLEIIPPEPLQAIVSYWGIRDANWFFDFPTSAAKVIEFLEASKMYKEKEIVFTGATALNIRVVETLLGIVGPISLPDYKLEINKNNLLLEIQREVESGADKKAGEPKRILKVLTPLLLERLNNLQGQEKESLLKEIADDFQNKNIMVYAKKPALQEFFNTLGIDGAMYVPPHNFWGSYLAVANANLEGGKSDAFIKQDIELEISLDTSGNALNHLRLSRQHNGNQRPELWWRKINQNFVQIFSNSDASLVLSKGVSQPSILRKFNYDNGFSIDPQVAILEKDRVYNKDYQVWSNETLGKTIFGAWFNVAAGQTKTLELRYQTPAVKDFNLTANSVYKIVFDKQSGVETGLKVAVNAPFGYVWSENGRSRYLFESLAAAKRETINLTLRKSDDNGQY
ncbi:MAG: DUF4012 domain-containing protein, partial [bacterium]|nr:DUF4012 domain-containing protein [bacterium]